MTALLFVIIILLSVAFYMVPTIVAYRTKHESATLICILNIILAGTGVVWIILLIWALNPQDKRL